jgi:hypothetical protein
MESQTKPLVDLQVGHPNQVLFKKASTMLNTAKAYEIDSPDMRDMAAQDLVKIKGLQKDLETQRKSITKPIDDAKKAVMDLFRGPTEYLEQAETLLKKAITVFDRAEEQRRIAEQARLEAEARAERARLEQEAAARDAAAREEAARLEREAAAAATAGDVEAAARLAVEAQQRVEQGAAEVETLQQTATLMTAPVVEAPRASVGISSRRVWKAEVADKLALIRYVAEHPEYVDLLDANMPAINKIALALKANCPLKGVHVFEDSVIAARAA